MTLQDLAQAWHDQRSASGALLAAENVTAAFVEAARYYSGFADILNAPGQDIAAIDEDTELTASEWATIKPLAYLYVEREAAIVNEASRGQGLEPIGRVSAEVEADIRQVEESIQLLAFSWPAFSVGIPAPAPTPAPAGP
jgi:hypothetical protein